MLIFSKLSILTILLDKCQMKSFENINILIKVKLFCLKNVFFWKAFIWKKYILKNKIKKIVVLNKAVIWNKKI